MFFRRKMNKTKSIVKTALSEEIVADLKLIASSNKIEAIKSYREMTNCDLRTAKNYIESLLASSKE